MLSNCSRNMSTTIGLLQQNEKPTQIEMLAPFLSGKNLPRPAHPLKVEGKLILWQEHLKMVF